MKMNIEISKSSSIAIVVLTFIVMSAVATRIADSQVKAKLAEQAAAKAKASEDAYSEAISQLSRSSVDAKDESVVSLCDQVSLHGDIPVDFYNLCASSFLGYCKILLNASRKEYSESDYENALAHVRQAKEYYDKSIKYGMKGAALNKISRQLDIEYKRVENAIAKKKEREREKAKYKDIVRESCKQVARKFGINSSLSEVQKEELWAQYEGKKFKWEMEVVEVSTSLLGNGYTVQWKCKGSESFIQDVQMDYGEEARDFAMGLEKNKYYIVDGRLKRSSTLLGIVAVPN